MKNNNKKNNVGSAWKPVSGSKKKLKVTQFFVAHRVDFRVCFSSAVNQLATLSVWIYALLCIVLTTGQSEVSPITPIQLILRVAAYA